MTRGDTHKTSSLNRRTKITRRILYSLLLVVVGGVCISWLVGSYLVAPAPQRIGEPPKDLPFTPVKLQDNSGAVTSGWHIRTQPSKGVVLLLHGIRGNRLSMLPRAQFLVTAGYSVVMIDLQAHGESSGDLITLGYREKDNVIETIRYIKSSHPGEPIAIIGVSLGGAAAVLASPLNIDAIILESVFPDIETAITNRVAAILGPFSPLPSTLLICQIHPRIGIPTSQLSPIDLLPDVGCPVFILSGANDLHTLPEEAQKMYSIAADPKKLWIVDRAAHVDLHGVANDEYQKRILLFLDQHMNVSQNRAN